MWILSDFTFVQSTTAWIFALKKSFGVTLVALEPLPPYAHYLDQDFLDAVEELHQSISGPIAFVSIGASHAKLLNKKGYYNLQIGKEPWVHLSSFEPTGKKSRGLRAAKKRALRDGVKIEKWNLNDILRKPDLKLQVDALHLEWTKNTFLSLEGFLLTTDPWQLTHDRMCFLARDRSQNVCGVLIATPLGRRLNWYLEDLWLGHNPKPGVAELLTLVSLEKLKEMGAEKVSLGLIPLTDLGFSHNDETSSAFKPRAFALCAEFFATGIKSFYNAEGMIGFRKRFKIGEWSPTYISVRGECPRAFRRSILWLQVMAALFIAHKPRVYFKNLFKKHFKAK